MIWNFSFDGSWEVPRRFLCLFSLFFFAVTNRQRPKGIVPRRILGRIIVMSSLRVDRGGPSLARRCYSHFVRATRTTYQRVFAFFFHRFIAFGFVCHSLVSLSTFGGALFFFFLRLPGFLFFLFFSMETVIVINEKRSLFVTSPWNNSETRNSFFFIK